MKIGVNDRVKKKLVRSSWAGRVERMGGWQREQMPRHLRGK